MPGYPPPFPVVRETAGLQEVLSRHPSLSHLCVILAFFLSKHYFPRIFHFWAITGFLFFFASWVLCHIPCSSYHLSSGLFFSHIGIPYLFLTLGRQMRSKQLVENDIYPFILSCPSNFILFLLFNLMTRKQDRALNQKKLQLLGSQNSLKFIF